MERTELIRALKGMKAETGSLICLGCGHEHNCTTQGCAIIRAAAEELEKIEAQPVVRGKWIEWWPSDCALIMTGEEMLWMCSECTAKFSAKSSYCPNCGADMREVGEDG